MSPCISWHVTCHSTCFTAEDNHHLIGTMSLVVCFKICYDSRGEERVEWVACQLVQTTLTRGMTPRGSHPRDPRSVRVAGNGPVAQLTGHLSSASHGRAGPAHAEGRRPMKTTSYGERDYAFGQRMLKLRTSIGLTQAGLAGLLGVSRQAVGEWEAGSSYPKAEHLKAL